MKTLSAFLVVLLCIALPAHSAELEPLPDLKSPTAKDKERVSQINQIGTQWWLKHRGLLAEESLRVVGYFSVARPIADFANKNDRVWEVRIVYMYTGVPAGILWVNDKNGQVIGLGANSIVMLDQFGNEPGTKVDATFQSIGYRLKPFCKYEKKANLAELCRNLKAEQITFDEFLGIDISKLDPLSKMAFQRGTPSVTASPNEVVKFICGSKPVSSDDWQHNYHHVANLDQYGYINTSNGKKIIWMLRPGGLGMLVYADGGTVFLAK